MKRILLGAAVFGMLMVSAPSTGDAQFFSSGITFDRPGLPVFSWQPQRERAFATFSPLVNDVVTEDSQPAIQTLNRTVFGTTGISRVSRFFGIR